MRSHDDIHDQYRDMPYSQRARDPWYHLRNRTIYIDREIEEGRQHTMSDHMDMGDMADVRRRISRGRSINTPADTRQASLVTHMEENPSLNLPVKDVPKNTTITGATVTNVEVGTRAELFDLDDGEQPEYGSRDDQYIRVRGEVTWEGDTFTFIDSYPLHDTLTARHDLGKYVQRYGEPEQGQAVDVSYDSDGNASIIID